MVRHGKISVMSISKLASAIALWVCILLSPLPCAAQAALSSEVHPKQGDLSTVFRFVVTVEGAQSASSFGNAPLLSGGDDFSLRLIGPQSSVVITNGSVATKISYHYRLTPRKAGTLTTPSVELDTATGKLTAQALSVDVRQSGSANNFSPPSGQGDWQRKFFLEQNVNPSEGKVYVGQQIVNTVTLYTQLQARDIHLDDLTTDGFWQETLSDDERSSVRLQGEEFGSIQILKSLYPLRSGEISIPSRTLTAKIPDTVQRRFPSFGSPMGGFDDDIFGDFFGFVEYKDVSVTSPARTVTVLPLPVPPPDIAPFLSSVTIVGDTKIKVDYSLDVLKVGGSKSVTIEIESEGNLHPVKELPFKVPSEVKVYEERPETVLDRSGPRIKMIKRFRYTLVPLRGGYFRVPSPALAYFNPRSERFEVTKGGDIAFVVQGGSGVVQSASPPPLSQDDIAPLVPTAGPSGVTSPPTGQLAAPTQECAFPLAYSERTLLDQVKSRFTVQSVVLLLVGVVSGLGVFLLVRARSRVGAVARKVKGEIRTASSYTEIDRILRDFIGKNLSISDVQGLTLDQFKAVLTVKLRERDVLLATLSLLDRLERGAYAPAGAGSATSAEEALEECRKRASELVSTFKAE